MVVQLERAAESARLCFTRCTFLAVAPPPICLWLQPLAGLVAATGVAAGVSTQLILVESAANAALFIREVRLSLD